MKRTKVQNQSVFMLEDEMYESSIIPFKVEELKRDVKIYNDVEVKAGIFANNIELYPGNIFIKEALYAQDSIKVSIKNKNENVWLHSIVSAKNSIITENSDNGRIRFSNTIQADNINLKNTIVYGNIFGNNIILENSIVLGGVYCNNMLELTNAIVGTIHTTLFKQSGKFGLIHNFAFFENPPEINNDIYSLSLITYNGKSQNQIYRISESEVYPYWDKETETAGHIISPSLRVFDLREFEKNLNENFQKIVNLTSMEVNNFKEDSKKFKDIENTLFYLIDNRFDVSEKLPKTNFIELPQEILTDYLSIEDLKQPSIDDRQDWNSSNISAENEKNQMETEQIDSIDENIEDLKPDAPTDQELDLDQNSEEESIKQIKDEDDSPKQEASDETTVSDNEENQGNEDPDTLLMEETDLIDKEDISEETVKKTENPEAATCYRCGAIIPHPEMKFCTNCGAKLE